MCQPVKMLDIIQQQPSTLGLSIRRYWIEGIDRKNPEFILRSRNKWLFVRWCSQQSTTLQIHVMFDWPTTFKCMASDENKSIEFFLESLGRKKKVSIEYFMYHLKGPGMGIQPCFSGQTSFMFQALCAFEFSGEVKIKRSCSLSETLNDFVSLTLCSPL